MLPSAERPSLLSLRLAAVVAALLVFPSPTLAVVDAQRALLEDGAFSEFDDTNELNGSLTSTGERAFEGSRSAHASYTGGGSNGYARGLWKVSWQDGDEVWYGGAFYLPQGFRASMQGQVDLMRWDNWESMPTQTEKGGVVIYGSDKRARLVRIKQGVEQEALGSSFKLPEGRWFWLEVHQRLSQSDPLSEAYVDGAQIASSTEKNSYGHAVDRIRYGLVAMSSSSQTNPLELWFDKASVSSAQVEGTRPLADFETGDCDDLFGGESSCTRSGGDFTPSTERASAGARSAEATIGAGGGVARAERRVDWQPGQGVRYGASFYLPPGFKAAQQAQVDLLRWDNYGSMPRGTERGGIVVSSSDKQGQLVRQKGGVGQDALGPGFELPEGRWFRLEVFQRFSMTDPFSEVLVDGRRVATSSMPNYYGNAIERLRYGFVSVPSSQLEPLSLNVDSVYGR